MTELERLKDNLRWHEANVKRVGSIISAEECHYLRIQIKELEKKEQEGKECPPALA